MTSRGPNDDRESRDGFALVLVLFFMLIVTAMLTPLVLAARTDFQVAANKFHQDRFEMIAEGIVTVIARDLAAPPHEPRNQEILLKSEPMRCVTQGLLVEARVQDQRGLADLNKANTRLLEAAFKSLGMGGSEAATLAATAEAFRAWPEDGDDFPGANPQLVVGGLKRAPFEAVEELYDFRGFRNVPPRALFEAFTVNGGLDVIGERMSLRLANVLPEEGTGQYDFVISEDEEVERPRTYHIEATVGAADTGVSGFAGSTIVTTGDDEGSFELIERVTNPEFLGGTDSDFSDALPCDRLFGTGVASVLATASR